MILKEYGRPLNTKLSMLNSYSSLLRNTTLSNTHYGLLWRSDTISNDGIHCVANSYKLAHLKTFQLTLLHVRLLFKKHSKLVYESSLINNISSTNSNKINYLTSITKSNDIPSMINFDSSSANTNFDNANLLNCFFHSVFHNPSDLATCYWWITWHCLFFICLFHSYPTLLKYLND